MSRKYTTIIIMMHYKYAAVRNKEKQTKERTERERERACRRRRRQTSSLYAPRKHYPSHVFNVHSLPPVPRRCSLFFPLPSFSNSTTFFGYSPYTDRQWFAPYVSQLHQNGWRSGLLSLAVFSISRYMRRIQLSWCPLKEIRWKQRCVVLSVIGNQHTCYFWRLFR